jgi:hypothetical protein
VGYKPLFSQDSTESIGQTSIYQISIEFCWWSNIFGIVIFCLCTISGLKNG